MKFKLIQRQSNVKAIEPLPWIPLFILVIFFSNNFFTIGKSFLIFVAVLILARRTVLKCFDVNFLFISIFFVVYFIISSIEQEFKTEFNLSLLVMPAVLYASGKLLAYKSRDSVALVTSFLLIGLSLASMTLLGLWRDVELMGFEQGSRNIAVSHDGEVISATVLGGTLIVLISLGGVFFSQAKSFGWIKQGLFILLFILSLLAAVRLGSRTLLAIGGACMLLGFAHNARAKSSARTVLAMGVFLIISYLLLDWLSGLINLDFYFRDRLDSSEFGSATAGGRLERWIGALALIPFHPLGWNFQETGYAHNFWLDAARNGGWPTLIMAILLFALFISDFKKALKRNRGDMVFSTFAVCLSLGFILLFMVEPILDGFPYVFGAFCLFFGVINARRNNRPR